MRYATAAAAIADADIAMILMAPILLSRRLATPQLLLRASTPLPFYEALRHADVVIIATVIAAMLRLFIDYYDTPSRRFSSARAIDALLWRHGCLMAHIYSILWLCCFTYYAFVIISILDARRR